MLNAAVVQNVLSRLQKVKLSRKANCWHALCPAHEDRQRSLSVWLGREAILIGCWAGCEKPRILQAIGLSMRDLFPDFRDDQQSAYPRRRTLEAKRREIEWYDYRDEAGALQYQVIRYEPKGFAQRRPDPSANPLLETRLITKWLWGLADTRRVLYKLPELWARPKDGILIVEGERHVNRLMGMGMLATCNVGGTGMSWRDEYSKSLIGRRVVILPDHDTSGYEHANLIAGSLIRHGAASVRYLPLPGLPDKGDVLDFLAAGGTRQQLIGLIQSAPEWCAKARKG